MDYIRTYRAEQRTVALLEEVEADVTRRSEQLQRVNADLGRKDAERQRVEDALRNREQELKQLNEDLEKIVDERTSETRTAYEELKQAESQLVQSGKLASIGQLAAGVAHEINNPVGFIQSNLVTLREYAEDLSKLIASYGSLENHLANGDAAAAESAREELSQLKEKMDLDYVLGDLGSLIAESLDGVERVGKIVQNLRDFSQVDKGERELADLNKGLESTLNIVWNELKYKATVQKNYGDIPKIMCSPMELNQVFMNILVNAAQAIEDRGTVTISSYCEDDHVCVAISDTGKGMSAEVQERIFEPFYTTKDVGKGTGLGLHVSYNIVKKHDGELLVESQEGVGTTFTIRLPIDWGDHHE